MASPAEAALRLVQGDRGAQRSVVINADKAVEHGRLVEVMDAVRRAGAVPIAIAVQPRGARSSSAA